MDKEVKELFSRDYHNQTSVRKTKMNQSIASPQNKKPKVTKILSETATAVLPFSSDAGKVEIVEYELYQGHPTAIFGKISVPKTI